MGAARRAIRIIAAAGVVSVSACDFFTGPKSPTVTSLGPTAVSGGLTFVRLVAGDGHTCGLTMAGFVYCWGYNSTQNLATNTPVPSGQLGDSALLDRAAPVKVAAGAKTFVSLTAGAYHTCALTSAGAAYCWGANRNEVISTATNPVPTGQLGDGTAVNQPAPVAVNGGLTFASISAGFFHTCALTAGGAAYCWGSGGLGVGDTVTRLLPAAVTGGLTFQKLSSGGTHTCGLTGAGAAYCWGNNTFGQLGDSTFVGKLVPTLVAGGRTYQSIVAGGNATCGIATSGSVYCWGDNSLGAVGDGTTTLRSVPTKIATADTLTGLAIGTLTSSVFTGSSHVCGLTAGGKARCWGNNNAGQLGDGSSVAQTAPTAVSTALTFASLAAGGLHSCGLDPSGHAYCWGATYVVGASP